LEYRFSARLLTGVTLHETITFLRSRCAGDDGGCATQVEGFSLPREKKYNMSFHLTKTDQGFQDGMIVLLRHRQPPSKQWAFAKLGDSTVETGTCGVPSFPCLPGGFSGNACFQIIWSFCLGQTDRKCDLSFKRSVQESYRSGDQVFDMFKDSETFLALEGIPALAFLCAMYLRCV
jgi:hypothetical protein